MKRGRSLLLVGLLGLGIFLRAWGLVSHELWIDEYGTWWAVAGESWAELWHRVVAVQGQSPLYYVVVRVSVDALGPGPLALRLPSFLCGIGLVALAYPLARRLFQSGWLAILAVAAFAVNERLVFYSQEARPYALALVCACASFYFYLGVLRGGGRGQLAGHLLSSAAAYYAHYLFGLIVVVQALHLLFQRRASAPLRPWIAGALGLAVLLAPGGLQLEALLARRHQLDWIPASGGPAVTFWMIARWLVDPGILAIVAAATALAAAIGGGVSRPRRDSVSQIVLWLLVPLLALGLGSKLAGVTLLHGRYAIVALPAGALLTALIMGLPRREKPLPRALPLLVFLLAAGLFRLAPHYRAEGVFSNRYTNQHWGEAVRALLDRHRAGDLVLYRTHFIELDAVVRGAASAEIASFVEWPFAAHLPPDRELARRPLPYSDTPATRRELTRLLRESAGARRVWILGLPPLLSQVAEAARLELGLRVERVERHGRVHLILLVRPQGSGQRPRQGSRSRRDAGRAVRRAPWSVAPRNGDRSTRGCAAPSTRDPATAGCRRAAWIAPPAQEASARGARAWRALPPG